MSPHPAPTPARTRLRAARQLLAPVLGALLTLALVAGLLAGTALWLLRSEPGTAWLLQRLPGIHVQGMRGALLSEDFAFERLRIDIGLSVKAIEIEGAVAQGMQWSWFPGGSAWFGVKAERIVVRRLNILTGPGEPGGKARAPRSLDFLFTADVARLEVAELHIGDLPPMRDIVGRATLGADGGRSHVVESVSTTWDRVHGSARGRIGTRAPFAMDVEGQFRQAEGSPGRPWQAQARATGSLQAIAMTLNLRGTASAGRNAPTLDLSAQVLPFADWSLGELQAETRALDLATLSSRAPTTRLQGTARLQSQSMDKPVSAQLRLDNELPGRWTDGRLPVRRLELSLSAVPRTHDMLELEAFELQLAAGAAAAGRVKGRGAWNPERLLLETTVENLRPQLADARAPAMALAGPLEVTLRGLPWPGRATAAPREPWMLALRGDLQGQLDARPQPVKARFDATLSEHLLDLREVHASTGAARADLALRFEQSATAGWSVRSEGRLQDFDPLPWWPGEPGSAWRQGPHRISADWDLQVQLPGETMRQPWLQTAQTTVGSGRLRVHDAQLSGVPWRLDLALSQDRGGGSGESPSRLQAELQAAGNRLTLNAQGDPRGSGTGDRLDARVQVAVAAALAPWFRLWPQGTPWAPRAGRLDVELSGLGRWPALRTDGRATMEQVQAGELGLSRGRMSWRLDTRDEQPLNASLELDDARLGGQALRQLRGELKGTMARHELGLNAWMPVAPPAWTDALLGPSSGGGTRAVLRADGRWQGDGSGGGRWSGQLAELTIDPGNPRPSGPAHWFEARDLQAELRFLPEVGLSELRAEAGSACLAEALTIRWDEVRAVNLARRPDFQIRARLEPFLVAPLLARAQPATGWSGDLMLGGTLDIRAEERFDADVVFERRSGDLGLKDTAGRQMLGLTQARLAVAAHDGQWSFTPELEGKSVGSLTGRLGLRTPVGQRWPDGPSPIEGSVRAKVAQLGIWNAWVPPGWRLAGQATMTAELGGRLGAPELSGRLQGSEVAVRNLLQGVDIRNGELDISLRGATAQVERLQLRAGDGVLKASGSAELGAAPVARLRVEASRLRLLGRVDRQLVISGQAALELAQDRLQTDGRFAVDEGLFDITRADAPSLDDDVVIAGEGPEKVERKGDSAPPPRRQVQVKLDIDLGERLRVRGRGLDTRLTGQLQVSTPGNKLAVRGAVRSLEGTYTGYGQKLVIDRGVISFNGPLDNPTLDILALRPNLDLEVGLAITGSLNQRRVRLYSDPEMSETEKLSWLVMGRESDGLGRADSTLLQRAAVALLAGEGEAPTDTLLRQIGIDELSFRQTDGEVRETVVSLGKQLSRRWYVGYERGVNATAGTWQLIYRAAQRFTLRAQSGSENSLDLIWVWRTDDPGLLPMRKSAPTPP